MNRKLRILWNSNAPWATSGYSQQTAELLPLIRDAGFPVAASNFFGQAGGKFMLDGIVQYPVINHTYGSDAMVLHGKDFKADVVFSLQDIWVLNPQDLQHVPRWIPWLPVDHDPITPPVIQNLKFAYRVMTFSKHGKQQLANHGIAATYIPHTVNTDIFKPMDKAERKRKANLPEDTFIIGMVSANKDNPPRKSFQEVLDAFKLFLQKVPKSMLYFHTNNDFPGGFNIKQYATIIGVSDKIMFPDTYDLNFNLTKDKMALIYNSFDMLLCPSKSEGFGIPIIEAQACGIPVVVNDFTSMPELIQQGKTGFVSQVLYKPFSPQGSYWAVPDPKSIYQCMVNIYQNDRKKMSQAARDWIVTNFDTKTVFEKQWLPYLEKLELEIYGK